VAVVVVKKTLPLVVLTARPPFFFLDESKDPRAPANPNEIEQVEKKTPLRGIVLDL
jgi:hypothetical protein